MPYVLVEPRRIQPTTDVRVAEAHSRGLRFIRIAESIRVSYTDTSQVSDEPEEAEEWEGSSRSGRGAPH